MKYQGDETFYLDSIEPNTCSSGTPAMNTSERRQGQAGFEFSLLPPVPPCTARTLALPACGYIYELQDTEG